MKVVYVIGPFRAKTHWQLAENVRIAERLGLRVAELGAMPLIPHTNTSNFDGLLTADFWIDGTRALLDRADAAITVAALGYSWTGSAGSVGEVKRCEDTHKPLFHDLYSLREWLVASKSSACSERSPGSALARLAAVADAYDASNLDEHRPEWGTKNPEDVELLTGRGGKELLTLADAIAARAELAAARSVSLLGDEEARSLLRRFEESLESERLPGHQPFSHERDLVDLVKYVVRRCSNVR